MFLRIRKQLAAPTFADDEDKTRIASWLTAILYIASAVAIIYIVLSPLIAPKAVLAVAINCVMLIIYSGILILIRRGHVSFASLIFSWLLWLIVTLSVFAYGSILSPGFLCYFGIIAVIGLFF